MGKSKSTNEWDESQWANLWKQVDEFGRWNWPQPYPQACYGINTICWVVQMETLILTRISHSDPTLCLKIYIFTSVCPVPKAQVSVPPPCWPHPCLGGNPRGGLGGGGSPYGTWYLFVFIPHLGFVTWVCHLKFHAWNCFSFTIVTSFNRLPVRCFFIFCRFSHTRHLVLSPGNARI
jgi:hypothetical protein